MEKTNYILKGLGYSYILTLATLLIYNLALTFIRKFYSYGIICNNYCIISIWRILCIKEHKRKRPYIRSVSWPYVHSMSYINSIFSKG